MNNEQTEIKFDTAGLEKIKRGMAAASKFYARVGVLGDKAARAGDAGSNALTGAVHEFGSASRAIPERSFLRSPLNARLGKAINKKGRAIFNAIQRDGIVAAFRILGKTAEGISKAAFDTSNDGKWPANAPATIAAKGSERPLIDTAQLRQSIASDVVAEA